MFNIAIVGAGQLGSRHLQALKAVKQPLKIQVIDPSESSLQVAKERYDSVLSEQKHQISYATRFESGDELDIAIVATNSNVRRQALNGLLKNSRVRNMILEKLLFTERNDYSEVNSMLVDARVKTWVNCPMRVMPVYEKIKADLSGSPIAYRVTGSQFGLVTNAIHYLDHAVHLCGCDAFELNVQLLDPQPIPSKRAGFFEFTGTLSARFENGSTCDITCHATGSMPVLVEIFDTKNRNIVRESEGKLWHADEQTAWIWQEQVAPIPFQSQITTAVVESILETGECGLTPYAASSKTHLRLLNPLSKLVQSWSPEATDYPFT